MLCHKQRFMFEDMDFDLYFLQIYMLEILLEIKRHHAGVFLRAKF